MSNRIVPILLWTLGLLAVAGSSFVLYNFAFNDWRLDGDFLSSGSVRSILQGEDAPASDSSRIVSWEFPISDAASVRIDAALCNISILPAKGTVAEIHLILSGNAVDTALYTASFTSSGTSQLTITALPSARWTESSKGLAELEILLPPNCRIDVRQTTGDLRVDGMKGVMAVEMGEGVFEGTALGGRLLLRNNKGHVRLERSTAEGRIELRSGKVELLFNEGNLDISAADEIDARAHFGPLVATTKHGQIDVEMISDHPRCTLRSDNGAITLKLLPGAEATIAARSRTGIITHLLPLDSPDSIAVKGFTLASTLNGGGDSVIVETSNGSILLGTYGNAVVLTPDYEFTPLDTSLVMPGDTGERREEGE